jgi:hypothetical protein
MEETKETMDNKYGCGCRRNRWRKWWFLIPFIAAAALLVFSYVVMLLWNAVIPHVFTSVNTITYCEAIGLLVLCKILFGGFKGRRGCGCGRRGGYYKYAMKEKWMNMTEEERAKFKEEWKNRGGSCGC